MKTMHFQLSEDFCTEDIAERQAAFSRILSIFLSSARDLPFEETLVTPSSMISNLPKR